MNEVNRTHIYWRTEEDGAGKDRVTLHIADVGDFRLIVTPYPDGRAYGEFGLPDGPVLGSIETFGAATARRRLAEAFVNYLQAHLPHGMAAMAQADETAIFIWPYHQPRYEWVRPQPRPGNATPPGPAETGA